MSWSPLNVLLQLAFAGGLLLGLAGMMYGVRTRNRRLLGLLGTGLASLIGIYLGLVLIVSVTSRESALSRGEVKHFCGFYIDCHLNVTVAAVEREASNGDSVYRVSLRFGSDARREALTLYRPGIHLVDGRGRRFDPVPDGGSPGVLSQRIEAGGSYSTQVVFRVPPDVGDARLLVTEMEDVWPDKLFEVLLIGDEDSLLHKKTVLLL
jgi:hypothetical protein